MTLIYFSSALPDTPPLDPTAEQARQQLIQVLSDPKFQAARPTPTDLIITQLTAWFHQLLDWLNSLFDRGGLGVGGNTALVVVVLGIALIIALLIGFLVFGVPRLNRRSKSRGVLFGDEDDRDSTVLRRAAEAAAAAGDYTTAIEEEFRSIARGLAERAVVTTFPGTTAHGFAVSAAADFPALGSQLGHAANSFDAVRYLGRTGTPQEWAVVSELERALRASRPQLDRTDSNELDEVDA